MPTESEKKRNPELEKWLVKVNPEMAKHFREADEWWANEANKDPKDMHLKQQAAANREANLRNLKERAKLEAGAAAQAKAQEAKQKQEEAKKTKELADWEKQKGRSSKALEALLTGLVALGDPDFLKSRKAARKLPPSSDPQIDKLLAKVGEVLELWNDTDKLPQAFALWGKIKPVLLAILSEGEKQQREKRLDAGDGFQEAHRAISNIEFWLGSREGWRQEHELEKQMDTPDIDAALSLRELKELEPTFKLWQGVNKQAGRLVASPVLKELSLAIDTYFSVSDPAEKLAAFKKAGKWEKLKTVADLVAFFSDKINESAKIVTEAAIAAAKKAGQEAAAHALEKKLAVFRKAAKALALYELAKSMWNLVSAVRDGDWHEIASSGFEVATSGISLAEAGGAMEGTTAAGATAAAVVIWATAEAILQAAELAKWFRELGELEKVVRMVRDAKKIVPTGKKMAVAAQLMFETEGATDAVKAGEHGVHEQEAKRLCGWVAQALEALGASYFSGGKNDVGYLLKSSHPAFKAFKEVSNFPDIPWEVSDKFKIILDGIKAVVDEGNKRYGDAGVALAKEEVGR